MTMFYVGFVTFGVSFLFHRSGTEEEYDEIKMLLEDILTFNRDIQELKLQEKEEKQKLLESNKRKASDIRRAAMEGRASKSLIVNILFIVKWLHLA